MAKILLEVDIKTGDAKAGLDELRQKLAAVGVAGDPVADALDRDQKALSRLLDKLEPARVAAEKYQRQQSLLTDAFQKGDISAARYRAAMDEVSRRHVEGASSATKLQSAFTSMLGTVAASVSAAALARGAFDLLKDSVKRAIDVTESRNLFAVSMGTMAEDAERWAKSLRNSLGLNAEAVKEQVGTWNNMLTNMGLGADKAYDMSKGLTVLTNDMASFFNLDPEEAFQKLQAGISGEVEPLKRLGVVVNETTTKAYAYKSGIAAVGEQLTEQQKILARYGVIMESTKNAQGDLARTIESPANQLRIMAARWDEAKVAIGEFMLGTNALPSTIVKVNEVLGDMATILVKVKDDWHGLNQQVTTFAASSPKVSSAILASFVEIAKQLPGGTLAEALLKAATALHGYADKVREADSAVAKLATSHKTTGERVKEVVSLTDQQKKALSSLLDELKPMVKLNREYAENLDLLKTALKAGEISSRQYAEAVAELGRQHVEAERKLLPLQAALEKTWAQVVSFSSTQYAPSVLAPLLKDGYQALTHVTALETELRALEAKGTVVSLQIDDSEARNKISKFAEAARQELERTLWRGIGDVIYAALNGEDVSKAWETLAKNWSSILADTISATLKQALVGGEGPLGTLKGGGILQGGWGQMTTAQKWQTGLAAGGTLLSYYGTQRQNQTASVVGGALSGASAGMSFGWVGALVGAVVGAYMGYAGSAGKDQGFQVGVGAEAERRRKGRAWGGAQGWWVDVTGLDQLQEEELSRQAQDKYLQTRTSMRSLARLLGVGTQTTGALNIGFGGETGNFSDWWQTFMNSTMPRAVFEQYRPNIEGGMKGLGISGGRAQAELASLLSGDFEKGLVRFRAWLQAIVDLKDIGKDLDASATDLRAEVTKTMRQSFLDGFKEVMDKAKDLTFGLDQLFSDEQVQNAQELLSLAQNQYQEGLNYFAQLQNLSENITKSFADVRLGFREQTAKEAAERTGSAFPLQQFYETQLRELANQLKGASSAEQVGQITSEMLRFAQSLWALGGQAGTQGDVRAMTEKYLKEQEAIAQAMIKAWQQEVADRNAEMKRQLDIMIAALSGTGGQFQALDGVVIGTKQTLDDFATSTGDAGGALDDLSYSARSATSALWEFIDALGTGAGPRDSGARGTETTQRYA